MAIDGKVSRALRRRRVGALVGAAFAAALAVGGCSSVPDAVNPVEWYKSTTDLFSSDDKEKPADEGTEKEQNALVADRGKEPPGADKPAPNLASVPERPRVTSAEERRRVAAGLVSDPDRPRYSSEAVQLQGAPTQVLRPAPTPAASPSMAAAPAPVARVPVIPAPPPPAARSATAPAPMPSTVAAAPPPPPPMPRGVEETYRARLADRLPTPEPSAAAPPPRTETPAASPLPARPPANAEMPGFGSPYETVVISGGGVQMGDGAAAPVTAALAPMENVTAEPLLPSPATAAPAAGGTIKVATILFDTGSARLDAADKRILRQVRDLQRQRGGTMRVVGHASSRTRNMDPIKHKMANYKISVDRAQSVAQELIRLGVDRKAVAIDAVADSVPVYYEIMPSGEAGNRRAEIYLDY